MNTATLTRVKTRSARRLKAAIGRASTRYRRPRAWTIRLTAISGPVSRPRLLFIDRRVASEEAQDDESDTLRPPSTFQSMPLKSEEGSGPSLTSHFRHGAALLPRLSVPERT